MSDLINTKANVQPFQFFVADDVLEAIKTRVATYPWHEMPDDGGWDYGTNLDYMKEFADYWVNKFNWKTKTSSCSAMGKIVC